MSFFKNIFSSDKKATLDKGLEKSSSTFFDKLSKAVVGKSKVDAGVLDNLEEVLVTSDVGVNTTLKVIDRIEARVAKDKYVGTEALNLILREEIASLLSETNSGESTDFLYTRNKQTLRYHGSRRKWRWKNNNHRKTCLPTQKTRT